MLRRIIASVAVLVLCLSGSASANFLQYQVMGAGGMPAIATSNETNCVLSAPENWVGGYVKMQGASSTLGPWTDIANSQLQAPGSIPVVLPSPLPAYVRLFEQLAGSVSQPHTYLGCGVGGIGGATSTVTFNAAAYGAKGDGTTDDTTAIQNALNASCPTPGGNAVGDVILPYGNFKITASLLVECSNEGIEGIGAMAPTLSTALGSSTITWAGGAHGTMLLIAAPAGTGSSNPNGNLSGDFVSKVKLVSGNGIGGTGGADYGVLLKGIWSGNVSHIACDGFTLWCVDSTFDTQFTVPGSSNLQVDDLRGESFNGGALYLDGSFSDLATDIRYTVNTNTAVKIGDGTTANDESDTDVLTNVVLSGTVAVGIDLSCNSNHVYIIGGDAQVTARGSSTCSGRNGATYADYVYGANTTGGALAGMNAETGSGLIVQFGSGQTYSYSSNSTTVQVPSLYWEVGASPPPNLDRATYVWLLEGAGNASADLAAVSNGNGAGHYTVVGSQPCTAAGITGSTWSIVDAQATTSPAPSFTPNPNGCVAVDGSANVGASGKGVFKNGVQPNSSTGGFSAEVFPLGVKSAHPQILTGTCASVATTGTACTFPNSFAFADTTYTCTAGVDDTSKDYVAVTSKATTSVTLSTGSGSHNADYTCIR